MIFRCDNATIKDTIQVFIPNTPLAGVLGRVCDPFRHGSGPVILETD
jgi:hypothetical protein